MNAGQIPAPVIAFAFIGLWFVIWLVMAAAVYLGLKIADRTSKEAK